MLIINFLLLVFLIVSSSGSKLIVTDNGDSASDGRHLSVLLAAGFWPGHLYPLTALGAELVKRGHNVTLCATVMEGSNILPDLPESYGIKFVSAGPDNLTQADYDASMAGFQSYSTRLSSMKVVSRAPSLTAFKVRTKVTEIINRFDILVSDISVVPVGVYHAKRGLKSIIFSSIMPFVQATKPAWPSPVGGSGVTDDMTFIDRLVSFLVPHNLMIKSAFSDMATVDEDGGSLASVDDYYRYPGTNIPLICDIVLGFDFTKTVSPLTHYVGPLLLPHSPALDPQLETWLNAKRDKTVVYIGMGSTGAMSRESVPAFVKGVMATRFDAVWRLNLATDEQVLLDDIDVDTNRFFITKWVPRQTLFQHPALAMSILHCGLNGAGESLYNGLPVICAPNFLDHYEVSARIYAAGAGVSLSSFLDFLLGRNEITAEVISKAIETVSNKSYSEQAKKMREIFMFAGGAKRASDLVEFYAEVGYDHLIPAYVKYEWSWVQYYNLDVHCLLLLTTSILLYSTYKLLKCCYVKCCARFRKQKVE